MDELAVTYPSIIYVLPRARAPPAPLATPLPGRRDVVDTVEPLEAVLVAAEPVPVTEPLGARPTLDGRTLPRVKPRVPLDVVDVACALLLSSSSAFRAAASLCRCSSCSRLSAACCLSRASCSMSAMSCDAPCQLGSRMRRWLCSVCDKMRVQVLSNVDAESTVRETV